MPSPRDTAARRLRELRELVASGELSPEQTLDAESTIAALERSLTPQEEVVEELQRHQGFLLFPQQWEGHPQGDEARSEAYRLILGVPDRRPAQIPVQVRCAECVELAVPGSDRCREHDNALWLARFRGELQDPEEISPATARRLTRHQATRDLGAFVVYVACWSVLLIGAAILYLVGRVR